MRKRLHELEPNVSDEAVAALWAPTGGIVCPFNLTIALAENANANGVEFKFNTEVTGLSRNANGGAVQTNHGILIPVMSSTRPACTRMCSTTWSARRRSTSRPRRGDYCLLDKTTGDFVKHTIFQLPGKYGKGVLVSPTVHGNTIVGPTAIDIEDREGTNTTPAGLDELIAKAGGTVEGLPIRQVITSFAGLRAHEDHHEFRIGEVADAPQFIDCAGIESPGLTSAPAIGQTMAELLRDKMDLKPNPLCGTPQGHPRPKEAQRRKNITSSSAKIPPTASVICRCETVTEGEILDAIRSPLGAKSLDGVKRRTRAGMGRCQAGFCSPRVMEILARELGVDQSEITKCGGASKLIVGTCRRIAPREVCCGKL
jgi:glycerol-3-phosphate dehydrogenase